ncbi:MAG: molecular chaperone DnaK [Nanobdellota archaeon]
MAEEKKKMEKILGIDLGTSNSAASILQGGSSVIIPSKEGVTQYGKAFPSIVAFSKDGSMLVGEPARRQAVSNPDRTIVGAKRKMGTSHKYKIDDKEYTPQQISAYILQKIKNDAEEFVGEKIEKAVVTVPAYFDDDQRQATKDAGKIAGLDVIRIINEPTAASLSYGIDKEDQEQKILVYDMGGGTIDVTVMDFGDGVFEVKSTSGDTQLGGQDMDKAVMDYLVEEFKNKEGFDLTKDTTAMQRLREEAEKAKIELSSTTETEINLPYITATQDGPKHLNIKLTRSKLEELVYDIVQKSKAPIETALKDAGLKPNEVDRIIFVGGPTRMPIVRKLVEDYIGKKGEGGIDPMECVSKGASIQAGVLAGEVKDVLLLDVTPLSLGIETLGGVMTSLIPKNTTIPTQKSQVFSTAADNQTAVTIRVFQGERPMAQDNKLLGQFDLVGIPPAPRGVPQIEVSFDIDADGIVHVSAKDKGTGKEQSIKITATHKLSDEDVEKMKKEAEEHAEEDKKRKERAETVNEAESLVTQYEKTIKDMGDKIDKSKLEPIQKQIDEIKELLKDKDNNVDKIKEKKDKLQEDFSKIATEMYQQQAQQEQASQEQGASQDTNAGETKAGNNEEDVVDADYTEEGEEAKK